MEEKLSLNELAVAALRESAKWCMFLAIVGFIGIALMLLLGVFTSVVMAAMPSLGEPSPYGNPMAANPILAMKSYFGIIYIVFALIYFFPVLYLFKYAKEMKKALEFGNNDTLANALVNLKSHHKFLGIMTIIMLSLYVLMFIGIIIFAASFASSMH